MRVRILGTGVCCPLGLSLDEVWRRLLDGDRVAQTLCFDVGGESREYVVCQVDGDPAAAMARAERRRSDRLHHLGAFAARRAVDEAGVALSGARIGVVAGVGLPSPVTLERETRLAFEEPRRVSPLVIPMTMLNGLAAQVARSLDATGPCMTVSTACSSGADALSMAAQWLSVGMADFVVAIGADAPIVGTNLHFFDRLSALTRRYATPLAASVPFGEDRDGFVMAEGAAAVVLSRAEADETCPLGAFTGFGHGCDSHHLTAPHPEARGARVATAAALAMAGLSAGDIASVNSHGTSTTLNDQIEAGLIAELFGPQTPVAALKSSTGHMIGGSGMLEALVAARTAVSGVVPPAGDYALAPAMGIALVRERGVETGKGPVVSNSFGFGGQSSVIVASP